MKNKKLMLTAVVLAALAAVGVTFASQQQPHPPQSQGFGPQTREQKRALREIRNEKGLKAAADVYGVYIEDVPFDLDVAAGEIATVAGGADLVIHGLIKKNLSDLKTDERGRETIVTDYTVQVLGVYKGESSLLGRDITVQIPGGRVHFGGSQYAEVRTPGFLRPLNQQEFILFLKKGNEQAYTVHFGRQGVFEVQPRGRIVPRARQGQPLHKNSKRQFNAFIKDLEEGIAKANLNKKANGE